MAWLPQWHQDKTKQRRKTEGDEINTYFKDWKKIVKTYKSQGFERCILSYWTFNKHHFSSEKEVYRNSVQIQLHTHCCSGANFPVMAFRTSWLARPPTAAANAGRVPLAVLDRQRTNSAFTEAWKKKAERKQINRETLRHLCACSNQSKRVYTHLWRFKTMKTWDEKKNPKTLTLFLRVAFTSSVSFSKTSASCKHLMASKWNCSELNVSHFNTLKTTATTNDILRYWCSTESRAADWKAEKYLAYPMLGSLLCCSWKESRASMAAWICSGAWWVDIKKMIVRKLLG